MQAVLTTTNRIPYGFHLPTARDAIRESVIESTIFETQFLGYSKVEFELKRTTTSTLKIGPGMMAATIARSGTMLHYSETEQRWLVRPEGFVTLFVGPTEVTVKCAKGKHKLDVIIWSADETPRLVHWFDREFAGTVGTRGRRGMITQPVHPNLTTSVERLDKAMESSDNALRQNIIWSFLYEVCGQFTSVERRLCLTPLPVQLPEGIPQLIEAVRKRPTDPWSLQEASAFVGYSPFHFSRVFKAAVGYGFHEFTDRTRTETAIEMLIASDLPLDTVATGSGFGSAQALRESIKEYISMTPSELRSDPDTLYL